MGGGTENLQILRVEGRELCLRVRRNPRARRITLSLDPAARLFRLSLPEPVPLSAGLDFAAAKGDWMRERLDARAARRAAAAGSLRRRGLDSLPGHPAPDRPRPGRAPRRLVLRRNDPCLRPPRAPAPPDR